jgi:hypothetical protein
MLDSAADHLVHNVLPSASEYDAVESALSQAFAPDLPPAAWETEARAAKRHAANLAVAIDGLTDRCFRELGLSKENIREAVSTLCIWPGTEFRTGAIERIRGVANAYKHENLGDASLPITSDRDVLVVGAGWGVDAWGVGKWSGVEVIVHDKVGKQWKFMGDAPIAINAWMRFLKAHGASLPDIPYKVCGFQLRP